MPLLLWVAGAMAFLAGTPELGWAIWSVVVINAVFSFWQEFQAEPTLAALLRVLPRQCRAMRSGQWRPLPVDQLVPSDLLQLEEGEQMIPADCRLIRATALYVDVSVLTGESLPVARAGDPVQPRRLQALRSGQAVRRPGEHPLQEPLRLQELANLLPAGATVASGHCEALVYPTGGETEFGQMARLTAGTRRSPSTLERHVRRSCAWCP
jgi:Ca2+-transporting ATPase